MGCPGLADAYTFNSRGLGAVDYVSWVVLAWIIAGIGLCLYYRQKSPKKIAAVGTFVAEDDLPLGEQPEALLTARATSVQHPRIVEEVAQHPEISDKGEH